MDNLSKQIEEIETLAAIYGEEFQTEDEVNRLYSIKIIHDADSKMFVKLYVKFPDSYPSISPPTFEISAPYLKQEQKTHLRYLLENVYLSYIGQNVIFQWIEKIREEMPSLFVKSNEESLNTSEMNHETLAPTEFQDSAIDKLFPCPLITHGEVIVDRKSSFQGHAASVSSVQQVRQVIAELQKNRKIQQATHNIYAYRIYNESNKNFIHDCDDDGEVQAGSRLLHLLEIMDAKNVVVMVSRWYGGIHLGPDRFRHINNAARQVLTKADLIQMNQK
ncbi:hypothetical protein TSAR_001641 [Trichomalopsis sarcophagae]|uniref:RWD domain-containing protein n=1 Tax=Trichomalopsis sarcophagae TaxID=543379 RepID=A0A232EYU5_9HYME|nr:hypothetical protein TSAR_001641 [Trichomalopsis sarcophagae]